MAITSFDTYLASGKQKVQFLKTAARTSVAGMWSSVFDLAGNPGAGVLNVGNTANGLVPTDAVAGFPIINNFGGTGYLSMIDYGNTVACRMRLYDRVFHAGAYAYNAAVTLASQPSYSSRMPGGTDFTGTELWVECVTAHTGILSVAVTYTSQSGGTGHTTGTVSVGVAMILGKMFQLPLAAGDTGLQKIESVTATVASAGTFNLVVARPLWIGRVRSANDGDVHGLDRTGMPVVFSDSAFQIAVAADSTSTGTPEAIFEVCNG